MCKRDGCPPELLLTTCLLELAIAGRMNLGLASSEHVVWRHISGTSLGMTARIFSAACKAAARASLFGGLPFDFAQDKKAHASTNKKQAAEPQTQRPGTSLRSGQTEAPTPKEHL